MKTIFTMDKNPLRRYSGDEYNHLREELLERMRDIFSHGFTLISMIGLLWTITGTLIANVKLGDAQIFLAAIVVFLFGVPVFVLYPFSIKYQDNLRVISSLSAYIKVFFEYPSLLVKDKEREQGLDITQIQEEDAGMSWEIFHCGAKEGIHSFFGAEYAIAAIVSAVLSGLSTFHFARANAPFAFWIIAGAYFLLICFVTVLIFLNSRTNSRLFQYGQEYFLVYLAEAIGLDMYDTEQAEGCIRHQASILKRDVIAKEYLKDSAKSFLENKNKVKREAKEKKKEEGIKQKTKEKEEKKEQKKKKQEKKKQEKIGKKEKILDYCCDDAIKRLKAYCNYNARLSDSKKTEA